MAVSALQNGLRGNINRLFRSGKTPSEAIAILREVSGLPKGTPRPAVLAGLSKSQKASLFSNLKSKKKWSSMSAAEKAELNAARRMLAQQKRAWTSAVIAGLGEKYAKAGRTLRKTHAGRYKMDKYKTRKSKKYGAGTREIVVVDVSAMKSRAQRRQANRASGKYGPNKSKTGMRGHGYPDGPGPIFGGRKEKKSSGGSKRRSGGKRQKGVQPAHLKHYQQMRKGAVKAGFAMSKHPKMEEIEAARAVALMNGRSRRNVSALVRRNGSALVPFGDLAFTNPAFGGVTSYLTGYALPVTVAGGVAGAAHAFASSYGVTAKLSDLVAKVPVVGTMVAEKAPYTLQGLIVGSGLALAAGFVGGQAGKYLAMTGGAALVLGGGIDAFNAALGFSGAGEAEEAEIAGELDAEMAALEGGESVGDLAFARGLGDLAFTNGRRAGASHSPFGDLAFTNGRHGLGDGFAFQTAPILGGDLGDYAQASLADAQYCGADFDVHEGQALLNGRAAFMNAFGSPSHRIQRNPLQPSHLAGRPGHRWGWLVKVVGWQRAQHIASMSPKHRVVIIHRIRKAAIEAYNKSIAEYQAKQEAVAATAPTVTAGSSSDLVSMTTPAAGVVAEGATGAQGVAAANGPGYLGDYLGDPAMFMGA